MELDSSVVDCSPLSVCSRGMSVVTTTSSFVEPIFIFALTVEVPTTRVIEERSKGANPSFLELDPIVSDDDGGRIIQAILIGSKYLNYTGVNYL
jgi:hypothetical protein